MGSNRSSSGSNKIVKVQRSSTSHGTAYVRDGSGVHAIKWKESKHFESSPSRTILSHKLVQQVATHAPSQKKQSGNRGQQQSQAPSRQVTQQVHVQVHSPHPVTVSFNKHYNTTCPSHLGHSAQYLQVAINHQQFCGACGGFDKMQEQILVHSSDQGWIGSGHNQSGSSHNNCSQTTQRALEYR